MRQEELVQEVITMMQNFKPEIALIKKRIDNLVERDYMERDKPDEQVLLYRA